MASRRWPRRWRSCLAVTVLWLAVTPEAAWASREPAVKKSYSARLSLATEHFSAQRYGRARELFDALWTEASAVPERWTIAFNAAVCSFALQDYADARRRFEAIARAGSDLAPLARINAGFSALRRGELDAAETLSKASPADGSDVERRRLALALEVRAARRALHERSLAAGLDAGFAALRRHDWHPARAELTRVVSAAGEGDDSKLADAHYGLGLVEMGLGAPERAQRQFAKSLSHRPGDARALLALASASEHAREPEAAEAAYMSALSRPLSGEDVASARRGLERLYALPSSGPSGYVSLGLGYDDNATQSGSRDAFGALGELATESSGPAASPFMSALVALDWTRRATHKSTWSVHYAGDWLALTDSRLQDFGLQTHNLSARWQWAPTLGTRVRLEAGGAHVLTGSTSLEAFEWDALIAARAEVDTGARSRARFQISERILRAPDFDYLDGHRLDAAVSQLWRVSAWELSVSGSVRYYAAGVERFELSADSFPGCAPSCDALSYRNAVSYWAPGLGLNLGWMASAALRLSALGRAEQRRYLDASGIPDIAGGLEQRRDVRWRAHLGAELALDEAERFRLTLDQTLLISASSVQFDPSDAADRYDLGDRNFVQNTTEVGVSASF